MRSEDESDIAIHSAMTEAAEVFVKYKLRAVIFLCDEELGSEEEVNRAFRHNFCCVPHALEYVSEMLVEVAKANVEGRIVSEGKLH